MLDDPSPQRLDLLPGVLDVVDSRLPRQRPQRGVVGQTKALDAGVLPVVAARRGLQRWPGEGEARQVDNPKNALVTGIGVIPYGRNWGTSAAMILEI